MAKDDISDDDEDGDNDEIQGQWIDDEESRAFAPPTHPHSKELSIHHSNRAACDFALDRNEDTVSECDVAIITNNGSIRSIIGMES